MDAASFSDTPDSPEARTARPALRVRSMSDLLSLVPVVLGFEPQESLVITAVAGFRPGFHARVDLPDLHDWEAGIFCFCRSINPHLVSY